MLRLLLFLQNEYKANVRSKAFIGIFQCSQSYSSLLYNEEKYLNVKSILLLEVLYFSIKGIVYNLAPHQK